MKKFFAMMVCVMMVFASLAMGPQEAFAATTKIPAEGKVQLFESEFIKNLRDEIPDDISIDKIERNVYGDILAITFRVTSLETYETDDLTVYFDSLEEVEADTIALKIYGAF